MSTIPSNQKYRAIFTASLEEQKKTNEEELKDLKKEVYEIIELQNKNTKMIEKALALIEERAKMEIEKKIQSDLASA